MGTSDLTKMMPPERLAACGMRSEEPRKRLKRCEGCRTVSKTPRGEPSFWMARMRTLAAREPGLRRDRPVEKPDEVAMWEKMARGEPEGGGGVAARGPEGESGEGRGRIQRRRGAEPKKPNMDWRSSLREALGLRARVTGLDLREEESKREPSGCRAGGGRARGSGG